jgi:hypothetical protein
MAQYAQGGAQNLWQQQGHNPQMMVCTTLAPLRPKTREE